MKIYIVGSVASGKSTLARKISHITGAPCYHLDEAVYTVDPSEPWGNKKRPLEERDRLFQAMLAQRHYIMEDAGRKTWAWKSVFTVLALPCSKPCSAGPGITTPGRMGQKRWCHSSQARPLCCAMAKTYGATWKHSAG